MAESTEPNEVVDNKGLKYHLHHNLPLILSAIFLSSGYFTFGYDGSVVSGCIAMTSFIKQFGHKTAAGDILPASDTSIITSVPVAGSFVGSLLVAWAGDAIGRRKTLWLACVISAVGAAIQTASVNVAMITVGRGIANVAIFMFLTMSATFQNELAPAPIRGAVVGLSIVMIDFASVVTSGINWATHANPTSFAYRLPIGLQCLWPVIIALGLIFVVDSPTYFLIKGNDTQAYASLRKVRQGYTEGEIESEMRSLKHQSELRAAENEVRWLDLFKGTNCRRTFLALAIGNFQQLSGIAFATNYATIFLKQVGAINPFALVLGLNILSLSGAVVGLFATDLMGRRALALTTFIIIFVIDVVVGGLGFADGSDPTIAKVITAFCLMFGFFYAAGFGPLTYVTSAEIPTARLRNKSSSFTFLTISLFNLVVTYVLPYIADADEANLAAKTYLIFAGWMLICIVLTYLYLPETKGRTPAELDEMFAAHVPAREFKGYLCAASPENIAVDTIKDLAGDTVREVHVEKA